MVVTASWSTEGGYGGRVFARTEFSGFGGPATHEDTSRVLGGGWASCDQWTAADVWLDAVEAAWKWKRGPVDAPSGELGMWMAGVPADVPVPTGYEWVREDEQWIVAQGKVDVGVVSDWELYAQYRNTIQGEQGGRGEIRRGWRCSRCVWQSKDRNTAKARLTAKDLEHVEGAAVGALSMEQECRLGEVMSSTSRRLDLFKMEASAQAEQQEVELCTLLVDEADMVAQVYLFAVEHGVLDRWDAAYRQHKERQRQRLSQPPRGAAARLWRRELEIEIGVYAPRWLSGWLGVEEDQLGMRAAIAAEEAIRRRRMA